MDFLWTDVSSLLSLLVMFMPTKAMVFSSAISMVNFKFPLQEFSLPRKILASLRSGINGQGVIYIALIEGGEVVSLRVSLL